MLSMVVRERTRRLRVGTPGLAGAVWLFRGASRLASANADWQPNHWLFVLDGVAVLELLLGRRDVE